jgi:hypothetical protein
VKNVLEIGICGYRDIPNNVVGASLFAWKDYFPNAMIYGIDNDGRFIFNDQHRIKTALCNAYDPASLVQALISFHDGPFDFICDDAVHDPLPQIIWPRRYGRCSVVVASTRSRRAAPTSARTQPRWHGEHPARSLPRRMTVDEYQTHKDERLLILTKA